MPVATVVLGARTQLGQALLAASGVDASFALVARDERDAVHLRERWPEASVPRADREPWPGPPATDGATVHACALGLIHPDRPDWDRHAAAVQRDLGILDSALRAHRGPTHVIFVSSALALTAPRAERSYYAGLKLAVEGAVFDLIGSHDHAALSVLYPGRLVADRGASGILHTPFERLARAMMRQATRGPGRRTIGLDARLLITWKSIQSAARALLP